MPITKLHKKQKAKNYTILAILVFTIILFFVLTITKIKAL